VWNTTTRVGRAVERIDHQHQIAVEIRRPTLLGEDTPVDAEISQRSVHGGIGHQIGRVLSVASTRWTPVGHRGQRVAHVVGDAVQRLEQPSGVHPSKGSVASWQ